MLDNVININYYSVETSENSNMKHRPIGLGLMGFQDTLYMQNISYNSQEAVHHPILQKKEVPTRHMKAHYGVKVSSQKTQ